MIIDPSGFNQNLEAVEWAEMENFDLKRLVNRNPGLVKHVLINGKLAVEYESVTEELGETKGFDSFFRATE